MDLCWGRPKFLETENLDQLIFSTDQLNSRQFILIPDSPRRDSACTRGLLTLWFPTEDYTQSCSNQEIVTLKLCCVCVSMVITLILSRRHHATNRPINKACNRQDVIPMIDRSSYDNVAKCGKLQSVFTPGFTFPWRNKQAMFYFPMEKLTSVRYRLWKFPFYSLANSI